MSIQPYETRNREIIRRLNRTDDTLEAIAADYGITRERVRQIGDRVGIDGRNRPTRVAAAEQSRAEREQELADREAERLHRRAIAAQIRSMVEGERISVRQARMRLGFHGRKAEAYIARLARDAGIIST
jgi:uncharacterized protein YaiL (DUF2058 family)